ncbi:CYTH-like domain-containing protein [Mycena pura]|uniref:mRNA-capping enzyme subunit beta n=1 Tax=Mycena pura TaxID=153505 RepID=A0AAD6VNU9_9AGAR|nr:CYTH-like domain-containing protein [Mycena pura]
MPRSESPPPQKRARQSSSTEHENGTTLPPLSLSILGVEPLDEFIKEIADFVYLHIMNRPQDAGGKIEVEAKVGLLRDKFTNQRMTSHAAVETSKSTTTTQRFWSLTATVLSPTFTDVRFESNMSIQQHQHFNKRLNELKMASSQPNFPSTPLGYSHLHLVDTFYPSDNPHQDKIRVTRDEKTGTVVECMRKKRLGDLNIFSPKRKVDWRVSVSLEVPTPHPIGSSTHTRRKDRLSYSHEEFSIDLTQVKSVMSPNSPPELVHELEIEFARPSLLVATAARRGDLNQPEQERNAFDELIRAFVNNIRILVRNAGDS